MDLDPKTEITLAVGIMQGLLATGNYTQPNVKGDPIKWLVRRGDNGEAWELEGLRCQFPALVVDDALVLLWELNTALSAGVTPATERVVAALRPRKEKPVAAPKKKAAGKKRKR